MQWHGLPVINTQECEEYRKLLNTYNAGLNCNNDDVKGLTENLQELIINEDLRKKLGKGSRKLGEEKFNRSVTYKRIVELFN